MNLNNNSDNNDWRSLSKLDALALGGGAVVGAMITSTSTDNAPIEILVNGLLYASLAGISRSIFNGIKDGARRGALVYGGYALGSTITYFLQQT